MYVCIDFIYMFCISDKVFYFYFFLDFNICYCEVMGVVKL